MDPGLLITSKNKPAHVHFVGIAGIAMGSVAAALKRNGFTVTGSDTNVYPPMSAVLKRAHIPFSSNFSAKNLEPRPDVAVIGNALSRGNIELEEILYIGIPYCSLAELVSIAAIKDKRSFVVTGTHGKSSATTILAWIFKEAGKDPGYMIGGLPNDLSHACELSGGDLFVIEGDEYDTAFFDKRSKFLHYKPDVLIINNLEYDHADIFPDFSTMKQAFSDVISIVSPHGILVMNNDDTNVRDLVVNHPSVQQGHVRVASYGKNDRADWRISNVEHINRKLRFDLSGYQSKIISIQSQMCGEYQTYNIAAAVIAALDEGVDVSSVVNAVGSCTGLKRRMEIHETNSGVVVIDDFAHHPTAIRETIRAAGSCFPEGKIWAVVEPRSNSMRRNIFKEQLTNALMVADIAIIAKINDPHKVPENERLVPEQIVDVLKKSGKQAEYIPEVDDIVAFIGRRANKGDTVIGMSNGSFDNFYEKLMKAHSEKR